MNPQRRSSSERPYRRENADHPMDSDLSAFPSHDSNDLRTSTSTTHSSVAGSLQKEFEMAHIDANATEKTDRRASRISGSVPFKSDFEHPKTATAGRDDRHSVDANTNTMEFLIQNEAPERAEDVQLVESRSDKFWTEVRRRILNFAPSWFAITMGVGITSVLLYTLPYQFKGLKIIATVIFFLNVVLFVVFLITSIIRYIMYPSLLPRMLLHPNSSLFIGTFPMGLSTLVNMTVFTGAERFGPGYITFAAVLYWINLVVAVLSSVGMPIILFTRQKHEPSGITAVWLLPSVACVVIASTGAIIAPYLSTVHAIAVVILSYMVFGIGFMSALLIMALYFYRLAIFKCPPNTLIISSFLPLGPCGQGSFAILRLGSAAREILFRPDVTNAYTGEELKLFGNIIYAASVPPALIIAGFGWFWLIAAVTIIADLAIRERGIPFNMGWWAFTFPLGTLATATVQLSHQLDSTFFKVLGTILSLSETLLCAIVAVGSAKRAWNGALFAAPCVGDLADAYKRRTERSDVEKGRV